MSTTIKLHPLAKQNADTLRQKVVAAQFGDMAAVMHLTLLWSYLTQLDDLSQVNVVEATERLIEALETGDFGDASSIQGFGL